MSTTTNPITVRTAFARAAIALKADGITAAISQPACCAGCAVFEDIDEGNEPFLLAYRIDGTMNAKNLFSGQQHPDQAAWLSWDNAQMPEAEFFEAVCRALTEQGFVVKLPTDKSVGFEVTFTSGVQR